MSKVIKVAENLIVKDSILDKLSEIANVAQFVSFDTKLNQRYSRVLGFEPNHQFESLEEAAQKLLESSTDKSVNVRSYTPEFPKSREFIYGLKNSGDVVSAVRRLSQEDLYTIINETVDINDGGVSGVVLGDVIEFAPKDTPRSVEKPGTASLPREVGLKLLETVYHFCPSLNYARDKRVEFSIHPLKRGYRNDHTIVWEMEDVGDTDITADIKWSNNFSKFIGDKAYGLLIAYLIGLRVPSTTVFSRNIAPFQYGYRSNTAEFWIRTCPTEQVPGKFTTHRGWLDPYKLMCNEDPDGNMIASVLSQEGIEARYSGALVTSPNGDIIIEGVKGFGEDFMLGVAEKDVLPDEVTNSVIETYRKAEDKLGYVRMEWVYDGDKIWVVQLHKGATVTQGNIIYPGKVGYYHRFDVKKGIDKLRQLISKVKNSNEGIELIGNVGITSHLGDILRRAGIPSKISNC
jgi:hypothetical protein